MLSLRRLRGPSGSGDENAEAVEPRRTYFCCFPLVLANICPWPPDFSEEQYPQNHSQYLSGLSRALFPTTFLDLPPVLTSPQSCLKHAYRPPFVQPPPLGKKSEKGCFFSLREERLAGLGAYIVGPRNPRPSGSRLKGVYVN